MLELLTALTMSIYDSPSDKTKVVVELFNEAKCAKLITDKRTLEQDYGRIEEWAMSVAKTLEP